MNNNTKMNFVVFPDVDGVLNTRKTCTVAPSGVCFGVEENRLDILSKVMRDVGADGVVLTTTWKNLKEDNEDYIYLIGSLEKHGVKVFGKTKEDKFSLRAEGILGFLESHPEIEEFVILDDQHFGFEGYSKLWEGFIDTQARGIEYGIAASKTPSVSVMLFLDAIEKYSKAYK